MQAPKIPGIELGIELGRGAHSVVYKARQGNAFCAVKLPQTRARWTREIYREAVALARVKHEGLPEVLEVGAVDGLPYLVMELIEGETLADTLSGARIEPDDVLRIAEQLASILGAVHDIGLVHRDVKPRNIILTDSAALKLVDFGFTTPMERTGTGDTAGTALYAAPEQLVPPGRVDARSDLYCVGRVLLECLVGPSFSVFRTNAETIAELTGNLAPTGLATVVGHLLAAEPSSRYPDAHALAKDLERVRDGQSILGPTGYTHDRGAPPTLARVQELAYVLDALRATREGGRLVVVRGARGSGKSRLLDAIERQTRAAARTLSAACREDDVPLATLQRILEACWATTSTHEHALTTAEMVDLFGNLAPIAGLISPRLRSELDLADDAPVPDATDALSEGAAEIILRIAKRLGRLAIVVDDIQWMDLASAGALVRAAHRVREAPLLLVLGGRCDKPRAVLDRFAAVRDVDAPVTELDLAKLAEDGVGRLVASYLTTPELDPLVIARIAAMADGTPLGVLEVLGAFLDVGALRPHARSWRFDPAKLEGIVLPSGTLALLGRRLAEVPAATRRVLEAAAICGTLFHETQVAAALDLPVSTVGYASVVAHRAGLIEGADGDGHRFIHDSLRETLIAELSDTDRRRLHQRVGELLSDATTPTFEDLCAAARHLALGIPDKDPGRVLRVATLAAIAAHEHFDDEAALDLQKQALAAASTAGVKPSAELYAVAAEASLRLGAVGESLESFGQALAQTSDAAARARILGRISWAHETNAEPEQAWDSLRLAFAAIGERLPVESVSSAARTSAQLARAQVARLHELGLSKTPRVVRDVDLLCQLHYQNARLGFEYEKISRIVQSGLISQALSTETESRATKARAQAIHACVVAALGRHEAGIREAREALALATRAGDATAAAFCTQMLAMATSLGGHYDEAIARFRELVDTYGPWSDLAEYCLHVMSGAMALTFQGHHDEAWVWLEKALARLRRSRTSPRTTVCVIHRARAMLATLDRAPTAESWLAAKFDAISLHEGGHGYHRIMSWAPRATFYLESDNLGADFETLVKEFDAEGYNGRSANVSIAEFHVAVAHARIVQCFRASPVPSTQAVRDLEKATTSLRTAARVPIIAAHASLAEGCLAGFKGDRKRATRLLAEAEALATRESAPWVLSAVARARAHFLRSDGKHEAARDQARVAETLAREHGALARARIIRAEFGLTAPLVAVPQIAQSSARSSASRTTRQLAALLHVARSPRRDLKADQQAAAILDELIVSLKADRGAIWFQPEVPSVATSAARHRGSVVSMAVGPDSPRGSLLHTVQRSGEAWPPLDLAIEAIEVDASIDRTRLLVVPLFLYEASAGALSMERGLNDPPFAPEDRQLLELLAHQVPITLEIARLLFEREQLHNSLQQAQKMEAIGQLAGGLAHDFNNMLAAMKVALSVAQERAGTDEEMSSELDIIAQATTRASQLTSQLLSFSRNQALPVAVHDVNQLVAAIEPMLRRVAAGSVDVKLNLSPLVDAVSVDSGSFDQALMNLLINARDAMPKGGSFTITTRNVGLDENAAARANVTPGSYVEVEVSDTGEGMAPETLARIFEPFFTTKAHGRGTGLGLATVYGFAKSCGGGIDVHSELGHGTQFRLYLKRADRPRPARRRSKPSSAAPSSGTPDTILVVDDDDLVRRSIAKILERNGYRVIAANGSAEALDVARSQGKRIGLVIMDVLLPGVTGPELGRRLYDLDLAAKLLFVSGFSAESAPIEDAKVSAEMLLQKPFSQSALLERVRKLMPS